MNFSLIVCTYQRAEPLLKLLKSVVEQSLYPDDIIIVDGSLDTKTQDAFKQNNFANLRYVKVLDDKRGLTKQRNVGISMLKDSTQIACFLDDDIILKSNYFEVLLKTYEEHPQALGVGGYIANDTRWTKVEADYVPAINEFYYDGYKRSDGSRFVLRKRLGLDADRPPAHLPEFSHGRSVSFLPPSGKTYAVEQFMGGVSSFKAEVLKKYPFSEYFEGYGLYEDADYTLRLSSIGKLFVNTAAQCEHHHEVSGRPNQFHYGKMVVKNGWYVWRVRWPKPSLKAKLKWHAIVWLLTMIRLTNVLTTSQRKKALTESLGRIVAWWQLIFIKPKPNHN